MKLKIKDVLFMIGVVAILFINWLCFRQICEYNYERRHPKEIETVNQDFGTYEIVSIND